jgi:hypothetical protein
MISASGAAITAETPPPAEEKKADQSTADTAITKVLGMIQPGSWGLPQTGIFLPGDLWVAEAMLQYSPTAQYSGAQSVGGILSAEGFASLLKDLAFAKDNKERRGELMEAVVTEGKTVARRAGVWGKNQPVKAANWDLKDTGALKTFLSAMTSDDPGAYTETAKGLIMDITGVPREYQGILNTMMSVAGNSFLAGFDPTEFKNFAIKNTAYVIGGGRPWLTYDKAQIANEAINHLPEEIKHSLGLLRSSQSFTSLGQSVGKLTGGSYQPEKVEFLKTGTEAVARWVANGQDFSDAGADVLAAKAKYGNAFFYMPDEKNVAAGGMGGQEAPQLYGYAGKNSGELEQGFNTRKQAMEEAAKHAYFVAIRELYSKNIKGADMEELNRMKDAAKGADTLVGDILAETIQTHIVNMALIQNVMVRAYDLRSYAYRTLDRVPAFSADNPLSYNNDAYDPSNNTAPLPDVSGGLVSQIMNAVINDATKKPDNAGQQPNAAQPKPNPAAGGAGTSADNIDARIKELEEKYVDPTRDYDKDYQNLIDRSNKRSGT